VEQHWAILSLRESNDPLSIAEIERDLRNRWPKVEVKFPAVRHGQLDKDNPLSSYIFVRTPVSRKIENSIYATRLLRDPSSRRIHKITDVELAAMAPTILLPQPGSTVIVTTGDFAGLEAVVVEATDQSVKALVELWSKKAVVNLLPNEFTHG